MRRVHCWILTTLMIWTIPGIALAAADAVDQAATESSSLPSPRVSIGAESPTQADEQQYAQRESTNPNVLEFEGGQYIYVGTAILVVLIVILLVILLR